MIVRSLLELPSDAISQIDRDEALKMLKDAYAWYSTQPLNDIFTTSVVDTEAELRKHFGEEDTAVRRVRRTDDALLRRAALHEETGSGMFTQHCIQEARALAGTHRHYFSGEEISDLGRREQRAIRSATAGDEFEEVGGTVRDIPREAVDWTRDTPEETVSQIVVNAVLHIPDYVTIVRQVAKGSTEATLLSMLNTTVVGRDKVVGETTSEEERRALAVDQHLTMVAELTGRALTTTVNSAMAKCSLDGGHLLEPFIRLGLDDSTLKLLRTSKEPLQSRNGRVVFAVRQGG